MVNLFNHLSAKTVIKTDPSMPFQQLNSEVNRLKEQEPGMKGPILDDRARFNLTGNGDVFNAYLPRRSALSPVEQQAYDAEVEKIIEKSGMFRITVGLHDAKTSDLETLKTSSLDPSTQYMIGAQILEGMAPSKRLNEVLEERKPFPSFLGFLNRAFPPKNKAQFLITTEENKTEPPIAGYRDSKNRIVADPKSLWEGVESPSDGYDVISHEFIHSLDAAGRKTVDGVLPGLTPEQLKTFKNERQKLYDLFKQKHPPQGQETDYIGRTTFGIRKYGFKNDAEFLAVTAGEVFKEQPEVLKGLSPKLYELYKDYFGVDPITFRPSNTLKTEVYGPPAPVASPAVYGPPAPTEAYGPFAPWEKPGGKPQTKAP